jgi:hypothetical protein
VIYFHEILTLAILVALTCGACHPEGGKSRNKKHGALQTHDSEGLPRGLSSIGIGTPFSKVSAELENLLPCNWPAVYYHEDGRSFMLCFCATTEVPSLESTDGDLKLTAILEDINGRSIYVLPRHLAGKELGGIP